jgi:hypothetical protein
MHVPLVFLTEWREFPSAPCLASGGGLDDSSRLHVVEIARVAWLASFQPLSQEKTCIAAHEQTLLPTKLSFPSYEIGKKVGQVTYQHPVVLTRLMGWIMRGSNIGTEGVFLICQISGPAVKHSEPRIPPTLSATEVLTVWAPDSIWSEPHKPTENRSIVHALSSL